MSHTVKIIGTKEADGRWYFTITRIALDREADEARGELFAVRADNMAQAAKESVAALEKRTLQMPWEKMPMVGKIARMSDDRFQL